MAYLDKDGLSRFWTNAKNYLGRNYIKRSDRSTVTGTLRAAGWSGKQYSFESQYPASTWDMWVIPNNTCTEDQLSAYSAAMILGNATTNVLTAKGEVPTVDIPIIILLTRKQ